MSIYHLMVDVGSGKNLDGFIMKLESCVYNQLGSEGQKYINKMCSLIFNIKVRSSLMSLS